MRLRKTTQFEKPDGKPLKLPTKAALNAFERFHAFKLPRSYREFIQAFGPGELSQYVRLYAPGYGASHPADLERQVQMIRKVADALIETYGHAELIKRMIAFSDTIGGDVIAWDPADATDIAAHEYKTVLLPDEGGKPVILADTFSEFVGLCLSKSFGKFIKSKSWQPVDRFKPFSA